jgi:hypothetical protein
MVRGKQQIPDSNLTDSQTTMQTFTRASIAANALALVVKYAAVQQKMSHNDRSC